MLIVAGSKKNMFKFDFSTSKDEHEKESGKLEIEWLPAQEINPNLVRTNSLIESLEEKDIKRFQSGELEIKYMSTDYAVNRLVFYDEENIILNTEHSHSDLLPGKYEGGLKIWEGTQDLANYLNKEYSSLKDKSVLDLGCGAGILGILACFKNANVVFQDYNSSVINLYTIINVFLNDFNDPEKFAYKFFSGDWESFTTLRENFKKFDMILTSETIYNVDNYEKLHSVFEKTLSENGIIFLAAKSYYFGVGGGTRQFEEFLKKKNIFISEVVWKFTGGVNREILKIFLFEISTTPN
ncbi:histidine protein methyltransferase 1 homolog [Chrysoperla carnea]|uniref:histidine protein methyltransferase 1 homolog n=1 Tax=Chrysoperla carnea TaxID=189513 RepID=UPI001D08E17A|nr:histidine protein methyltransferase 1 homolog [Chrysoperla carnea]